MKILKPLLKLLPALFVPTIVFGTIYGAGQLILRSSANDPQIQMAEDTAAHLGAGQTAASILPPGEIDARNSLAPFMIIMDSNGKVIASNVKLDGQIPAVPQGVLDYTAQHSQDRITWQPASGVRVALVAQRYSGANSGYVLAGRSLREVEKREAQLFYIVSAGWIIAVLGLLLIQLGLAPKNKPPQKKKHNK